MNSVSIFHYFWVAAVITFHCNSINFLKPLSSPSSFRSSTMTNRAHPAVQWDICRVGDFHHCWFQPPSRRSLKQSDVMLHSCFSGLVCTTTSIFIVTPSLEKWPNKAKDPNLTLRHGYSPPDANPVFLYQGDINIIITIIIIVIIT